MSINNLDTLYQKIRALINDHKSKGVELFEYKNSPTFIIAQNNIEIIKTTNKETGQELSKSFNEESNELTLSLESAEEVSFGDKIEVSFNFYNYSNNELKEYIRASFVWLNIYSSECNKYEVEDNDIYPTPNDDTLDLIAIIASIIIKPNYSEYKTSNHTVRYPRTMTKEDKIEQLIKRYKFSSEGIVDFAD